MRFFRCFLIPKVLTILTGKIVFYSVQYKNVCLAVSDLFHIMTQSIKLYTYHYHVLNNTDVWKTWFFKQKNLSNFRSCSTNPRCHKDSLLGCIYLTIDILIEVFIQVIFKHRTYFIFKRFINQHFDNLHTRCTSWRHID